MPIPRTLAGRRGVIGAVLAVVGALVLASAPTAAQAAATITSSSGHDYFTASGVGYRYGPSMITDSAGLHVYTCSPGEGGAWDEIRYSTSTDGGVSWSADQVVLQGTPGGADHYSACDPGVVAFGGYYYIAYTSTGDARGTDNDVFVARSTSMTGPFEKWNGSGWGGSSPQPIVTYDGPAYFYGAGEPSLVVVGTKLYVFYTWNGADANGAPIQQTRLSTAATTSANWPASLAYQGVAIDRTRAQGSDSDDVKWVPSWNKFIAINSAQRFGAQSYIQAWESPNGLDFQPADFDSSNVKRYAHNAGISGDASGQLDPTAQNYLGYAYGSIWASWNTSVDPIALTNTTLPASPQIYAAQTASGSVTLDFAKDSKATSYTVGYGTTAGTYSSTVTGVTSTPYTLNGLANGTTYHVAIKGVGSSGSSGWGQDVAVTPQAFQAITGTTATASSTTGSLVAANAVDGNASTFWSSTGHSGQGATEYLTVDTGSTHTVGRVLVTSRQPSAVANPSFDSAQHAVVQTSLDGSTWTTVDTRATTTAATVGGVSRTVLTFPSAAATRYVRILATQLNADDNGNFYLQLGEVEVDSVPGGAIASSSIAGWPAERLVDADPASVWSSTLHASAAGTEWAGVDLGSAQPVSRLVLTPRAAGAGFPTAFSLQSSTDGSTWTTIAGQTYSGYANPGGADASFGFATTTARYFRVLATTLGGDGSGNYVLQLGRIRADTSRPASVSVSSTANSGHVAANAIDQSGGTSWSSAGHSTPSGTEWIQLDLGSSTAVDDLWVDPNDAAFPSAFSIASSTDGTTWTTVPGQNYGSYVDPQTAGTSVPPSQQFHFTKPVTARYLRITATGLRADSYGNYYFQVRDLRVAR